MGVNFEHAHSGEQSFPLKKSFNPSKDVLK